jgi:hypothetical protein
MFQRKTCPYSIFSIMKLRLHRCPGYFGRASELDVLINGEKVAVIASNETKAISIPESGGTLQVQMHGVVSSQTVHIEPTGEPRVFECGTPWWVLLDVLSICYLPKIRHHVFFLRPVTDRKC